MSDPTYAHLIATLRALQSAARQRADDEGRPDELFQAGQLLTAAEVDEVLAGLADRLLTHDHSGGDQGAVLGGDALADGSVEQRHLADDAVTADAIADDAVTADAIADDAVGGDELADGAVDTRHLADDAVTLTKLDEAVRALLDQRGEGGPTTEAYCYWLDPALTLVDDDSAGAPSAKLPPPEIAVDDPGEPPWWNVLLAGRGFAAWEHYVGRLDKAVTDAGKVVDEMTVHWDPYRDGDAKAGLKAALDEAQDELDVARLLRLAQALRAVEASGQTLTEAELKATEALLDKHEAKLPSSVKGTMYDLVGAAAPKGSGPRDSVGDDFHERFDLIAEGGRPRRGNRTLAPAAAPRGDDFDPEAARERVLARLDAEAWFIEPERITQLRKLLPDPKTADPAAIAAFFHAVAIERYAPRTRADRFPDQRQEAVHQALTKQLERDTESGNGRPGRPLTGEPIGERAVAAESAGDDRSLALVIEALRWAGIDETAVNVAENLLLTAPASIREKQGGGFGTPALLAGERAEAEAKLTTMAGKLVPVLGPRADWKVPPLGVEAEPEPERVPPTVPAAELAELEAFILASLAREPQAARDGFAETAVHRRKRHALWVEGPSLCRGPFHPGLGDNAALGAKGVHQTFTAESKPKQVAVAFAALLTTLGYVIDAAEIEAYIEERGVGTRLLDLLNHPALIAAGWVTTGDRNVRAITTRRHGKRLVVRVHFALPYAHCGYRVQVTCDQRPGDTHPGDVTEAAVQARARDHVDLVFARRDRTDPGDQGERLASSTTPFSLTIHGELAP